MDLIKRIIKIGLFVAVLGVAVNDLGQWATAQYTCGNVARESAEISAQEAKRTAFDREASWRAGEAHAAKVGATIYGFEIKNERAYVWVRMPVKNTVLLQPVYSLIESRGTTMPLVVEDENMSLVQ